MFNFVVLSIVAGLTALLLSSVDFGPSAFHDYGWNTSAVGYRSIK